MSDPIADFRAALESAGLIPGEIVDGVMTRCATSNKPHSKNGCFVFHGDHPASGWFSDWQTGESQTWTAKNGKPLTADERRTLADRVRDDRAAREEEQSARWEEARNKAASIWEASQAATDAHKYLLKKGIRSLGGIRQSSDGRLVVPVLDERGHIQSLQFIASDGGKSFLIPFPSQDAINSRSDRDSGGKRGSRFASTLEPHPSLLPSPGEIDCAGYVV